jgi:4-aminobutyrate aminotransferase
MQYVWDSDGKRYLDCFAGVSVNSCGHCNPAIVEAAATQMASLQHLSSIYLSAPAIDLAERLTAIMPHGIRRSFFCNSGSEANEGAFLAARLHTGKRRILAIEGGLHGRTFLGMATTGLPMWRTDPFLPTIGEPSPDATVVSGVYDASLGRVTEASTKASLAALESALSAGDAAAVIVEPIQGNGGIVPLPAAYLRELRRLCSDHGALLVADEVQTGFARTGAMFAMEIAEVTPDIVTVAKALGNGVPIAAWCATEEVSASFTRPSASTLGGNPVSAAAALAVLDYIEAEGLVERAAALGARLESGLRGLAATHPAIVDVRGAGLMLGAELRKGDGSPDPEGVDRVLEYCKDAGLLVGKNGLYRNVLAFQPPLVLTEADIDTTLGILGAALDDPRCAGA